MEGPATTLYPLYNLTNMAIGPVGIDGCRAWLSMSKERADLRKGVSRLTGNKAKVFAEDRGHFLRASSRG